MEPTQELVDELFRERVLKARRVPMNDRGKAGGDLFDDVCQRMRAGIRAQFPEADERRVEEILRQRIAISKRIEELP